MSSGGQFDPFNQARLPAPPLEGKGEERLVQMNYYSVRLKWDLIIMYTFWVHLGVMFWIITYIIEQEVFLLGSN